MKIKENAKKNFPFLWLQEMKLKRKLTIFITITIFPQIIIKDN